MRCALASASGGRGRLRDRISTGRWAVSLLVAALAAGLGPVLRLDGAGHRAGVRIQGTLHLLVGLGVQLVPQLLSKLSPLEHASVLAFEVELLGSSMMSLKAMEPDLASVGVAARDILTLGFRKHPEIYEAIRAEFTDAPGTPPGEHIMNVLTELLFPFEGREASVPAVTRVRCAIGTLTGSHVPLGTSATAAARDKAKQRERVARVS